MNHTSQGCDRKRIRALVATLIPALNSCKPRMTTGERRLGERLEAKLEDDYLLWYDVAIGGQGSHPDLDELLLQHQGALVEQNMVTALTRYEIFHGRLFAHIALANPGLRL